MCLMGCGRRRGSDVVTREGWVLGGVKAGQSGTREAAEEGKRGIKLKK